MKRQSALHASRRAGRAHLDRAGRHRRTFEKWSKVLARPARRSSRYTDR